MNRRWLPLALLALLAYAPCPGGRAALADGQPAPRLAKAMPEDLRQMRYHLTARPWRPLVIPRDAYLDKIEGVVRFSARHQDNDGAIIDPFIHKEHQYATPYYAHALGVLLSAGRANDLLESGQRAMEWATRGFERNQTDGHRPFYIWPLVSALDLYQPFVPEHTVATWRRRLESPVSPREANTNNWTTYLMKGDWLRGQKGLIGRADAVKIIEDAWRGSQRQRIMETPGYLYHDTTSDPDTLAVETVGRGNLLALIESGYDGPSAAEMRRAVETGTLLSLLLMDPSGQMPCNGRTDDHVWGDVGYQLAFEVMAERASAQGALDLAGQYRRAAMLVFRNLERWRRADGDWAGSYFVTKNHIDPARRVGYQTASQYSNYNGSLMHHLAEAYCTRRTDIPESPAPVEIGGYAFVLDDQFSSAFANAGGMQLQIDLRGDTALRSNPDYWCALGVVRLGRVDWDTRLGPSDGARRGGTKLGVSFAPTFEENGAWIRLASVPDRYEGKFSVQFVHPVLVRCAVDYAPRPGKSGPTFRHEFVLTPDGVLASLTRTSGKGPWGVTLPLLENDGASLETEVDKSKGIARTRYASGGDEQNFIVLGDAPALLAEPPVCGAYGDLQPVRATAATDQSLRIFIYPRNPSDPPAEAVRNSFIITPTGFRSVLHRVEANTYVGRTSAGGIGTAIDLKGDGRPDTVFSRSCGFSMQLDRNKITSAETDREVHANIQGEPWIMKAYTPASHGEF